jgi:hypothetical protein
LSRVLPTGEACSATTTPAVPLLAMSIDDAIRRVL